MVEGLKANRLSVPVFILKWEVYLKFPAACLQQNQLYFSFTALFLSDWVNGIKLLFLLYRQIF